MSATSKLSTDPAYMHSFLVFRQRLLKTLLTLGATAILIIWYLEWQEQRLMVIDRVAYPLLSFMFISFFIIIQIKPETLVRIEILSFATLTAYLLLYVYAIIYQLVPNITIYDMATFTQWFPLVYTSAFMFLQTRHARIASILIYLAMLFPVLHQLFFNHSPFMSSEVFALLLNMNISHPVYIAVLAGIAQLKENFVQARSDAENMRLAANIDYLTGVANRRATVKTLQQSMERARATRQVLAVMLIDIDHFKSINDTYGHDNGDLVLITFAEGIRTSVPPTTSFGRWGGEEFLAMTFVSAPQEAILLAERLRSQLESMDYPEIGRVTASLGIAIQAADDTLETLVKRADQALYRAKENGRNQVVIEP